MARLAATALALLLAAMAPAAGRAAEEKPPADAFVDLATLPLPVVVDGKLVNYVFVIARLQLQPGADNTKLREQEPFFRDALVRESARRPFTLPGELNRIDEARVRTVLGAEVVRRVGPKVVKAVTILSATPRSHVYPSRKPTSRTLIP